MDSVQILSKHFLPVSPLTKVPHLPLLQSFDDGGCMKYDRVFNHLWKTTNSQDDWHVINCIWSNNSDAPKDVRY